MLGLATKRQKEASYFNIHLMLPFKRGTEGRMGNAFSTAIGNGVVFFAGGYAKVNGSQSKRKTVAIA